MNNNVLEALDLGMRYGHTWALQNCTLDLEKGRIVGLVGPNGAGKTTLINLIVGLLSPTAGQIRVFGFSPTTQAKQVLPMIGFVGQDRPLYHSFSVRDIFRLGQELNPRWDNTLAIQQMKQLAIPLDKVIAKLSGGQQAQVALAMALAKRPDLLLLDEPVATLDPLARRAFFQTVMNSVAESGTTVLFSSHQVADLDRICDTLILLSSSHLQLSGKIDELLEEHRWISCPIEDQTEVENLGPVLQTFQTYRSSKMLIRVSSQNFQPTWDVQPISLEDLILAYLALTEDPRGQAMGGQSILEAKQ